MGDIEKKTKIVPPGFSKNRPINTEKAGELILVAKKNLLQDVIHLLQNIGPNLDELQSEELRKARCGEVVVSELLARRYILHPNFTCCNGGADVSRYLRACGKLDEFFQRLQTYLIEECFKEEDLNNWIRKQKERLLWMKIHGQPSREFRVTMLSENYEYFLFAEWLLRYFLYKEGVIIETSRLYNPEEVSTESDKSLNIPAVYGTSFGSRCLDLSIMYRLGYPEVFESPWHDEEIQLIADLRKKFGL